MMLRVAMAVLTMYLHACHSLVRFGGSRMAPRGVLRGSVSRAASFGATLGYNGRSLGLWRPLGRKRSYIGQEGQVLWMSGTTSAEKESSRSSSDVTAGEGGDVAKVNLNGLKSEVDKSIYRTLKKLSKKKERVFKLTSGFDAVDEGVKDEIEEIEIYILGFEENLQILRNIDEALKTIKGKDDPRLATLVAQAAKLGVTDSPKELPKRGPKKPKGKPTAPRLPYSTYKSADGIEIRVGRASSDNDEVSCNPKYRDGADWWMHVSGCPGSHVVIRSHEDSLQGTYPQTITDAALLAVVNSKSSGASGKVKVNLTRARNVSKPMGAKPGLVRLSGDIYTVSVDTKAEAKRLERLMETKNAI